MLCRLQKELLTVQAARGAISSSAHTYRLRIFKERVLRSSLAEADGVRCSGRRRSKLDQDYGGFRHTMQGPATSFSVHSLQNPSRVEARPGRASGIGCRYWLRG